MKILSGMSVATFLIAGAVPLDVHACTCVPLSMSEAFQQADHVFLAEIRDVEVQKGTTLAVDAVMARFRSTETFKGNPASLTFIRSTTSDGICGIGKLLLSSKRIIVFTRSNGLVGACDGTRAYEPTANASDIEALRRMRQSAR